MSIIGAFVSHLRTLADVSILVGNRIFRDNAPEDTRTLPYIVVTRTPGSRREGHQTGTSSVVNAQLLVDAYAATPAGAETLGQAIRRGLDGLTNSAIGNVPNRETIARVVLEDDFPDVVESSPGAGIDVYRWNQNWTLWVDETATVFA